MDDTTATTAEPAATEPTTPRRQGVRTWVTGFRPYVLTTLVVGVAYLVNYVSRVRTLGLFAPDSRYYAAMALEFGGTDRVSAAAQVAEYARQYRLVVPPADVLFGWALVQPRIVMPALSAPFVKIFGVQGLAVVPGLAMATLTVVLTVALTRRYGAAAAMGTMVLLVCSPQLISYGSAMLTESLSALWGALILLAAWRYQRGPDARGVVLMVALTVVLGFTRQSTLIPASAMVFAWLCAALLRRRPNVWRVPALAVGVTAVVVQVLQVVLWPGFSQLAQFEAKTYQHSLLGALHAAPGLAWRIFAADAETLARRDHVLLVLLALAVVSMVVFWRRSESHLLLGALVATELYNVTNGTPTAFRYGMPGLAFVAVSVALLLSEAARAALDAVPRAVSEPASDETPIAAAP